MYTVNIYDVNTESNVKVAENFKVREFACKDGTRVVLVATKLADYLQMARKHFKKPLNVNSGYRTVAYNKKIGGASNSQHIYGTAADVYIKGVSSLELYNYFCEICPDSCGIGIYDNFVHFDVSPVKRRWDERTKNERRN